MNRELAPEEITFNDRINAIFLRKEKLPFEEVVRRYRQIEEDCVERSPDEQDKAVETRRRITEWLLIEAQRTEQPHEVCREIWDELMKRGFSDHELKDAFTGIYARCCQMNGEFDAGIAVLEAFITEFEQWLADTTLTPEARAYGEKSLATDYMIRDELKAGIRERLMPRNGPWEPEEIALTQRINAVDTRERKHGLNFEDAACEYRQIEAEFVERAGGNEIQVAETKRRITEVLLDSAYGTRQSHEVCRGLWEELVQRGFTNEERQHTMGDTYVRCCLLNREFDAGLAVIEKLITELESNLEDTTLTKEVRHFREKTLHTHCRRRDKLISGIK